MAQTRLSTRSDEPGAVARCQLVVIEGPQMGRAVPLDEARTVGLGADADLKLSDDTVSALHVSISPGFVVKDLGSTNGTFFEGSRITEATLSPLRPARAVRPARCT